jgi:hypothetical protein
MSAGKRRRIASPEMRRLGHATRAPGYFTPTPIVLSRDEIARIHKEHAIHSIERFITPSLARRLSSGAH